jgi:pyridoxine 5-phosphate synthase
LGRNIRLGVNIDHVATLRNARGGNHPEIINAALVAQSSGADLITVHLREDRRHINENDLENLLSIIDIPLNLEIAATTEMIGLANKYKPQSICFVPENRLEITTEGGLNVSKNFNKLKKLLDPLLNSDIKVGLFIDPNNEQLMATQELGVKTVEFHTGEYAEAFLKNQDVDLELEKIKNNVQLATKHNISCHAGHGVNFENVFLIASIPNIEELNIGHFLIGDSIFNGLENSISKMRNIIKKAVK